MENALISALRSDPRHWVSADGIYLSLLDQTIAIECEDRSLARALLLAYDALVQMAPTGSQIRLRLRRSTVRGYLLTDSDGVATACEDIYDVLFYLDKIITLAVQRQRPDLLFVHAAALEFAGQGILLVAPSGAGKSTTTWAALHHGFAYLSDEHAPINLRTGRIEPYPRALWLRREPPAPYTLPTAILRTPKSIHVPVISLPSLTVGRSVPLHSAFFLRYDPAAHEPQLRPVSLAQASARIFSQALLLNDLGSVSLQTVVSLMSVCRCYELTTANLAASLRLLKSVLSPPAGE